MRIRIGHHVLKEVEQDDVTTPQLSFGSIPLASGAEATSVLATLGTGSPSRFTHGNAIAWLADNVDAWGRTAALIKEAGTDQHGTVLHIMQLQLDVGRFSTFPIDEEPKIVLGFDPPSMTQPDGSVRELTTLDDSIEHLILDAANRGVTVRMQFTVPTVDMHFLATLGFTVAVGLGLAFGIGFLLLAVGIVASLVTLVVVGFITGALLGAGVFAFLEILGGRYEKHAIEVSKWFTDAQAQDVSVRILKSQPYSVTHTKIVTDGKAAVLLGSPFEQVYFDGPGHVIDDFRRGGDAGKGPIHEMSMSVRGPAVGHLEEVFNTHWNVTGPTDHLPVPPGLQLPGAVQSGQAGRVPHFATGDPDHQRRPAARAAEGRDGRPRGAPARDPLRQALHLFREPVLHERGDHPGPHRRAQGQRPAAAHPCRSRRARHPALPALAEGPHPAHRTGARLRRRGPLWSVHVVEPCAIRRNTQQAAAARELPTHEDGTHRQHLGHVGLSEPRRRFAGLLPAPLLLAAAELPLPGRGDAQH